MEARAQHQFQGTEVDELAFQAGDLLKVRPPPLLLCFVRRFCMTSHVELKLELECSTQIRTGVSSLPLSADNRLQRPQLAARGAERTRGPRAEQLHQHHAARV